jgi:hypothetical protein
MYSPLSTERRAPRCVMPSSTRQQEQRRLCAFDACSDRHGPADYDKRSSVALPRSPVVMIGNAPRESKSDATLSPGPTLVCHVGGTRSCPMLTVARCSPLPSCPAVPVPSRVESVAVPVLAWQCLVLGA